MLEMLHSSGAEGVVFSNLGPGPTVLIGGDYKAGFFGECSTAELITGPALATAIGLIAGIAINSTEVWLKFIIDGKIVYIAKKPFRYSVAWSQINEVGAVFGSANIQVGPYRFSVSLPLGKNPDTSIAYATGYDTKSTWNSEWNRLLYPITVATTQNPKNSQVGPNWANYTEAELWLNKGGGSGGYTWCQETGISVSGRIIRSASGVSYINYSSWGSTNTVFGWRPRLELLA